MLKQFNKLTLLPQKLFMDLQANFSYYALYELLFKRAHEAAPSPVQDLIDHNTINRISNTVGGGGLFQKEASFYGSRLKFYFLVKTEFFDQRMLEKIGEFLSRSGYGADKSTGKGYIELESVENFDLPAVEKPNAFVSLSCFVPDKRTPRQGYYEIFTKYGKLGGDFANSDNPFKKPIIMLKAGATFLWNGEAEPFGCLMDHVNKNPAIRHYAYALPIYIRLSEEVTA